MATAYLFQVALDEPGAPLPVGGGAIPARTSGDPVPGPGTTA
jgi:hypothetical protein